MTQKIIGIEDIRNRRSISKWKTKLYKLTTILIFIAVLLTIFVQIEKIMHINILNLFKDMFLLKYLPKLGADTGYGVLFVFGVLTSFHCIGMCGGIAISQCVKKSEIEAESTESRVHNWVAPSFLYNFGRVVSYTLVGGLVGGLGHVMSLTGIWKGIVPIVGGIFMMVMAINLLGVFPILRKFNIRMPYFIAKKINKNNYSTVIVGLLSGLMPCGPLQIVQLYALGTRSVILGAAAMFIFAIGTVPVLFILGAVNTIINKKYSKTILKVSAVMVLVLGVVMIGRGLALSGISLQLPRIMNINEHEAVSRVQDHIQTVITTIEAGSFPPIEVKRGIPVKWIIKADKDSLNECNNAITVPEFKIEKKLVAGDNLVEFIPDKTGEFVYTCWMGMIKSKITVVEDVEKFPTNPAAKPEIDSAEKGNVEKNKALKVNFSEEVKKSNTQVSGITGKHSSKGDMSKTDGNKKITEKEFKGVLIDEHCFKGIDPVKDTKVCLQMEECEASGYGAAVKQQSGKYIFYKFDKNGQAIAKSILGKTAKDSNITLLVKGTLNGAIIKVSTIREEK